MKKNKVKYNRKEYREEYLNSDEWNKIRDIVFSSPIDCSCCEKRKASDLHHMVYRKDVSDINLSDLLPVCRKCHDYIHQAIRDGYISKEVKDLEKIREMTLNILDDKEYENYAKWLRTKHYLTEDDISSILKEKDYVLRLIAGIAKKAVWKDNLGELKLTGIQIEKIRRKVRTAKFRRENNRRYRKKGSVFRSTKNNGLNKPLNLM